MAKFFNWRLAISVIRCAALGFAGVMLLGSDFYVNQWGEKREARPVPMQLDEAVTLLRQAHSYMKERQDSGDSYLCLAIDPGDSKTRRPTRYWIFDFGPVTGYRWVAYPRSLPGVYTKGGVISVNGGYPTAYLTENGDLISMYQSPDIVVGPSDLILIAYGSTTASLELRDDSGRTAELMLRPEHGVHELSPDEARRLESELNAAITAAKLANDECERIYGKRPFSGGLYRAELRGNTWCWGRLDPAGVDGFSAEVSFAQDGSNPKVKVYFSTDKILDKGPMKHPFEDDRTRAVPGRIPEVLIDKESGK
jgi:hypothetical protein